MSGTDQHLSDLALDALRLQRGADADQAHLDGCGVCGDRLAELVADAAAFEDRFSPEALAAETLDSARPSGRRPGRRAWIGAFAAAAAAAILVVALPQIKDTPRTPTDRVKGASAAIKVRVKRDGVVSEGRSGQAFRAGDALMIGLHPGRHDSVRLVYRDAAGKEEVWFEGPTPAGRWTWTEGSFVLDDARGRERLVAEFGAGAVYGGSEQVVFEVRKE